MEIQIGLGADIVMAFDECTEHPADAPRVRASMEMTLRWAERSKRYFEEHKREVPWYPVASSQYPDSRQSAVGSPQELPFPRFARDDNWNSSQFPVPGSQGEYPVPGAQRPITDAELRSVGRTQVDQMQALFGIVQGGMDRELRRESALRTVEIGFPGYAIGGLSVGEPRELTREIVESTLEFLPSDRPRYLMGVGTPEEIALYARMGVDMMDCVLPTRAARHGLLFTSEGRVSIKQARYAEDSGALDSACDCSVCTRYSRAYLRHLYASNELLAQVLNTVHNLHFYLETMRRVRAEIANSSPLAGGIS
jgi:queuine tRNA-ribosyltransferase